MSDTGIGISQEAQRRLFQPFSQADGSTTRKYGGTGLGLAISKQLAELMGGQVGVVSSEGQGSRFWFTVGVGAGTAAQAPAPSPARIGSFSGLRVCIVDDNATNRTILERYCREWGMSCRSVCDGRSALAAMREAVATGEPFDLGLLDMLMPEMDGIQLARAVRADPALASMKLVMLTSWSGHSSAKRNQDAQLDGCLTKPVRHTQLFDCLRIAMGTAGADRAGNSSDEMAAVDRGVGGVWPGRVLVADDNPMNQKIALKMLEKIGYKVDVVSSGREAVEAVFRQPYALVFMDCQMPEMDGLEATQIIRAREQTEETPYSKLIARRADRGTGGAAGRRIPIVAMTSSLPGDGSAQCLAAGMDEFVTKPVSIKVLAEVATRWIAGGGKALAA